MSEITPSDEITAAFTLTDAERQRFSELVDTFNEGMRNIIDHIMPVLIQLGRSAEAFNAVAARAVNATEDANGPADSAVERLTPAGAHTGEGGQSTDAHRATEERS